MPKSVTPTSPAGRSILIVTSGPLCQNPRPLKEALSLAAMGFQVTVLTVFQNQTCHNMDLRLIAGTTIHQEVLLPPDSFLLKFCQRAITWLTRKLVTHLHWSSPRALGPVGRLLRRARNIPADLTIVHNEAPFWVGVQLMKSGRKVAADFEDWYSEDLLPSDRRARPLALIRQLEQTLLHQAVHCTTTSQSLAQAIANAYVAAIPVVLPNCFDLQATPVPRPSRSPELVWFSQTIGPGRGLEEFITHWGRINVECGRLTLIGNLIAGFDQTLLKLLQPSARERLIFAPPCPPDELPQALSQFDVGLALEHRHPANKDLTTSNKIFQYFNAGLAVIATPTSGQMEVMHTNPPPGMVVDLDTEIASQKIAEFLGNQQTLRAAQQAARKLAETRYHWGNYSPVLLDLVARATHDSN